MANATLKASRRDQSGKGAARKLRGTGRIPAVLYGHGDKNESLSLDAHELELLLAHIASGSTLISLDIDGRRTDVLIRELQRHPYKPEVMHVDFLQVHGDETLTLSVPIRLTGTPKGVMDDGGVLDQVLYELEIECLPRDIPEAVEIDISRLGLGESLRVHDITFPNATILNDGDLPVASVLEPRTTGGTETDAAAEPEVVRGRGGDEG
jgi:large subunit ribosomal protein L25